MTMQVDKARLDEMLDDDEVEAAARAIAGTAYEGIYFTTRTREEYIEAEWRNHSTDARTAITAAATVRSLRSTEGKEARDVHELEASVSALEEERQNLISTKREQIKRLEREREAAEARVAKLREALEAWTQADEGPVSGMGDRKEHARELTRAALTRSPE